MDTYWLLNPPMHVDLNCNWISEAPYSSLGSETFATWTTLACE